MKEFIEVLQILLKYGDSRRPFKYLNDEIYFAAIQPDQVSKEDKIKLTKLGVYISEGDMFYSYMYAE